MSDGKHRGSLDQGNNGEPTIGDSIQKFKRIMDDLASKEKISADELFQQFFSEYFKPAQSFGITNLNALYAFGRPGAVGEAHKEPVKVFFKELVASFEVFAKYYDTIKKLLQANSYIAHAYLVHTGTEPSESNFASLEKMFRDKINPLLVLGVTPEEVKSTNDLKGLLKQKFIESRKKYDVGSFPLEAIPGGESQDPLTMAEVKKTKALFDKFFSDISLLITNAYKMWQELETNLELRKKTIDEHQRLHDRHDALLKNATEKKDVKAKFKEKVSAATKIPQMIAVLEESLAEGVQSLSWTEQNNQRRIELSVLIAVIKEIQTLVVSFNEKTSDISQQLGEKIKQLPPSFEIRALVSSDLSRILLLIAKEKLPKVKSLNEFAIVLVVLKTVEKNTALSNEELFGALRNLLDKARKMSDLKEILSRIKDLKLPILLQEKEGKKRSLVIDGVLKKITEVEEVMKKVKSLHKMSEKRQLVISLVKDLDRLANGPVGEIGIDAVIYEYVRAEGQYIFDLGRFPLPANKELQKRHAQKYKVV